MAWMVLVSRQLTSAQSLRHLSRLLSSETPSQETVSCGIWKNQPDPPLKADEEYPEWLWKLLDKQPTLKELKERYLAHGEDGLSLAELERLSRLGRKRMIRDDKLKKAKF